MKNIPWIKEYPTDELKEIATFSLLERGAYYSLKLIYHTNPEAFLNERTLFAMCLAFSDTEQTAVQTVVERLFEQNGAFPFNERLSKLENTAIKGLSQKSLAGKKSGEARRAKGTAVRTINDSDSDYSSKEEKEECEKERKDKKLTETDFHVFWDLYGKKGTKRKAKDKFLAIKKVDLEIILDGVRNYQSYCRANDTEWKYVKDASSWLHNECWNDSYPTQKPMATPEPGNDFVRSLIG